MPSPPTRGTLLTLLLPILGPLAVGGKGSCRDDGSPATCEEAPPTASESCRLFLAPRDEGGRRKLGVFAAVDLPRSASLLPRGGDVVLHLIDVEGSETPQLGKWLSHGFLQDASTSGHGGNYEGLGRVLTALSGAGMLASSPESSGRPNVWASVPEVDEADLPRGVSPLAGSFSWHHGLAHVVTAPDGIGKGEEVLVDRDGWHQRTATGASKNSTARSMQGENRSDANRLDIKLLFQSGTCLDNVYCGTSTTSTHVYGRGGFASRFLEKGAIVAPVPVLPVPRKELNYLRSKDRKKVIAYRRKMKEENQSMGADTSEIEDILPPGIEWRQQLLLNYCLGHQNSSMLLFPYGHANYVNHAPSIRLSSGVNSNGPAANVALRWSERLLQKEGCVDPRTLAPAQLWDMASPERLVLEMVALRDIHPGEEILLDYGSVWVQAWEAHVRRWNTDPNSNKENDYSPSYVMEDVVSNLRTVEEQLHYPYPDNLFTACFYRFERGKTKADAATKFQQKKRTEATPWKMSSGLFDMTNLRPCRVISREAVTDHHTSPPQQQQTTGQGKHFYTAMIQNRPGLPPSERIPNGEKHIVSGIPRQAFRFVDRPYTTDLHLDGAFRQNIGLEEVGIFPEAWLDAA